MNKTGERFQKLVEILATLRGPNGCPWDKEQTYQTINPYLLEEAHEVVEAVDQNDFDEFKEELGDLLIQILFYSQMAAEEKKFAIVDVLEEAANKLVRRHPHVFGDTQVSSTKEVLENWEKIKQNEKKKKNKSLFDGLPKAIPALLKAFRIGEKTSRVGFDWPDQKGIIKKVDEELKELNEALQSRSEDKIQQEYGDLLFTLANLGRFLKVDPETALRKAADRFIQRFQWIEKQAKAMEKPLQDLNAKEWDSLWEEAKEITSELKIPQPS